MIDTGDKIEDQRLKNGSTGDEVHAGKLDGAYLRCEDWTGSARTHPQRMK
jgi:hypothetical protein